jgi:branched-subunit amino acid transport protein AzlD
MSLMQMGQTILQWSVLVELETSSLSSVAVAAEPSGIVVLVVVVLVVVVVVSFRDFQTSISSLEAIYTRHKNKSTFVVSIQ